MKIGLLGVESAALLDRLAERTDVRVVAICGAGEHAEHPPEEFEAGVGCSRTGRRFCMIVREESDMDRPESRLFHDPRRTEGP